MWIRGVYLNYGSASMDLHDGAVLAAAGDAVVVSMTGSFGLLAVRDGSNTLEGNQGLTDQLLALEWVSDHIARFGGDIGDKRPCPQTPDHCLRRLYCTKRRCVCQLFNEIRG